MGDGWRVVCGVDLMLAGRLTSVCTYVSLRVSRANFRDETGCKRCVTVCNSDVFELARTGPLTDARAMSSPFPAILIVDDDPDIRRLTAEFLIKEGFEVSTVADGVEMDAALQRKTPDLIVLDLMLPGEDGLSICRRLQASSRVAILMLTAKSDEVDRVIGLEMGADDYLSKPFGTRELLARIRAILRRVKEPVTPTSRRFAFDEFVIDLDARQISDQAGQNLDLTSGEFNLLALFVQRPRRVLSRDHILDHLRGRGAEPFDRTVDMTVSRLRRKLGASSREVELISTVRNSGYLFTPSVQPIQ